MEKKEASTNTQDHPHSDSDGSYDSLEDKPEEFKALVKTSRPIFESQENTEYYSQDLIILGHKLKDLLMKEQFKKMYDFVLPARRKAKQEDNKKLYISLIKRQLELTKEFYHIADEAIDDAYGDCDKFEDSMEHWAENDPKFPQRLERFMEEEAMTYYAEKAEREGRAKEVTVELILRMNERFVELYEAIGDGFFETKETDIVIDLKFNWALDTLFEEFGLDLGVEKLRKERFEDERYLGLRKRISDIYNLGG